MLAVLSGLWASGSRGAVRFPAAPPTHRLQPGGPSPLSPLGNSHVSGCPVTGRSWLWLLGMQGSPRESRAQNRHPTLLVAKECSLGSVGVS